jgi:GNAT superfamily N-acetyltransferase
VPLPHRLATENDVSQITDLMRASILVHFPRFYDARQSESAAIHIGEPDLDLIRDGTYFVFEDGDRIVACGGWSRRGKLYTGSGDAAGDARLLDPATEPARVRAMFVAPDWARRGLGRAILDACEGAARAEGFTTLSLMATLPGEQLYRAYGFAEQRREPITMPDGVQLECVAMTRPVT